MNKANMPANNLTDGPKPLGTIHNNKMFTKSTSGGGTGGGKGKQNMPTKNAGTLKVPLGTTKHDVGGVPAYLKGRK